MNQAVKTPERRQLEMRAAAAMELRRRNQREKTVYGFYRPTDVFGGELVRCLQEQDGRYVEVDKQPTVHLPAKLEPFLVTPKRFKVLFGGRGGAKTRGVGGVLASKAKDYGEKTLCLREMQNTIEDSVHALLSAEIRDKLWSDFVITDNAIRLRGEDVFKYRGMARNVTGVQSAHGFKYSWVEEAQSTSSKSLEALTPTIREAGSELVFTMNPGSSADPMSQRFIQPFYSTLMRDKYYEDDLHLIIWINYDDNPWHRELEGERLFDLEHKSNAFYQHKWLGHYNDEVANAIIPAEWFDAAIDAHVKLGFKGEGARIASYDPSDLGPDDKGYALRHGSVVEEVDFNESGDVNEGTDWAIGKAIQGHADYFTWDGDGMGVALKRQIDQALDGKRIEYLMFRGSETAEQPLAQYIDATGHNTGKSKTNQETFFNRRAQFYIRLRDRFYATYRAVVKGEYINPAEMISLSSEIKCMDQLRAEVCRIPLKPNSNGKIQILSKVEMAKKPYELPSPNLADALMQTMMTPPAKAASGVTINFEGWG